MRKSTNKKGRRSNNKRHTNNNSKKIVNLLLSMILVVISITTIGYIVVKDNQSNKEANGANNNQQTQNETASNTKSDIQDLIDSEENKDVLSDLKSDKENGVLVYKYNDNSYYEYIFKNNKITEIYFYTECGNKHVAEYMLESYKNENMKSVYSSAEIYKESAIKAKLTDKLTKTYSNYTMDDLMKEMKKVGKELK